jgi:hypothetical protein
VLIRGRTSGTIVAALRAAIARAWLTISLTAIVGLFVYFVFGLSLGLLSYYYVEQAADRDEYGPATPVGRQSHRLAAPRGRGAARSAAMASCETALERNIHWRTLTPISSTELQMAIALTAPLAMSRGRGPVWVVCHERAACVTSPPSSRSMGLKQTLYARKQRPYP